MYKPPPSSSTKPPSSKHPLWQFNNFKRWLVMHVTRLALPRRPVVCELDCCDASLLGAFQRGGVSQAFLISGDGAVLAAITESLAATPRPFSCVPLQLQPFGGISGALPAPLDGFWCFGGCDLAFLDERRAVLFLRDLERALTPGGAVFLVGIDAAEYWRRLQKARNGRFGGEFFGIRAREDEPKPKFVGEEFRARFAGGEDEDRVLVHPRLVRDAARQAGLTLVDVKNLREMFSENCKAEEEHMRAERVFVGTPALKPGQEEVLAMHSLIVLRKP